MKPDSHEIYRRRRSRNRGLGLVLGAFVIIVFAVTMVKLDEADEAPVANPAVQTAPAED